MAGDFTIAPATSAAAPEAASTPSIGAALFPAAAAPGATAAQTPPLVNPGLHLDLALNLVVLQFFDSKGDVTQSIPSQKQLDAYAIDGSSKDHAVSRVT